MKPLAAVKWVPIIQAQILADNAYFVGSHQGTTPVNVDTKTFHYGLFVFQYGESDIAMAELSLYESDTTTDGDFAVIASSNFATSPATLPSATADNTGFGWLVPFDGRRKRYLRVNAKAGNGTNGSYGAAYALLWGAEAGIDSATDAGFAQLLTVS